MPTLDGGEPWSDSQIAAALDTSVATIARACQQLAEAGFYAVLTAASTPPLQPNRASSMRAAEAKLIAPACPEPPKGRCAEVEAAYRTMNDSDR
jgi:hypothetical protein